MAYLALADLVAVIHALFVLFVVLGGWLALRWRWLPWLHLPALAWGAAVELGGWICPLTPLENWLRQAGGEAGYGTDFIGQYLLPLLYPPALTRALQMALGGAVLAANGVIYGLLWRRARRPPAPSSTPGEPLATPPRLQRPGRGRSDPGNPLA